MKRTLILVVVTLFLLLLLVMALNAPRYAEARAQQAAAHAHQAAAEALETQATVTGIAVAGLVFLAVLVGLMLLLLVAAFLWLQLRGGLPLTNPLPHPTRRRHPLAGGGRRSLPPGRENGRAFDWELLPLGESAEWEADELPWSSESWSGWEDTPWDVR